MPFVFMVVHYPSEDRDGSILVGYSRWESKDAFLATGVTFGPPHEIPDGEVRPRDRYFLTDTR
jgi:hypothetical protein